MKLENVKAVITGAGSGLGEGTARYLKDRGAKLLLIDLNADGLKKVAALAKTKANLAANEIVLKAADGEQKKRLKKEPLQC